MHCDCWIGHHTSTLINLYSAYAHRPSFFRWFRCCGCCAAAATASQPVSSAILHAPPVESGHWLVGSRGVTIILPTTSTTKNQPHLNWEISLRPLCPFHVIVTVGDSLIWSSCSLGHSSRAIQCHATPKRTAGSISVVSSCSPLLINSQRSPESHIYAPLGTFSLQTQSPSQQSCLLIVPHVISTRTGCSASSIRCVRVRSPRALLSETDVTLVCPWTIPL